MADQAPRHQESMYCHACHHEWRRQGEGMECPACMSASTEIITPEHDPRYFHNRQPRSPVDSDATATARASETMSSSPSSTPSQPSSPETGNPGGTAQHASGSMPPPTFARIEVPPVTFISFNVPPPPTPRESQASPPPISVFGMEFLGPFVITYARPPTMNTSSPAGTAHNAQNDQHTDGQHTETQQSDARSQQPPQPGPHPAAGAHPFLPTSLLARIMSSIFNPSNAIFGDAVFSQEALDRIISQLREQEAPGGAPPASQAAIDRLQTKEIDEKMLGVCSKCVICVDDMTKGEKAAVLPCHHFFHGECVTPWLKQHNTCPVCRRSIEVEKDEAKNVKSAGVGSAAPQSEARNGASDAMDCS